ncbi:MAG: hypothetical protein PHY73_06265 [Candidatus Omnitrophica bacterium]|nr:hypothetical protein [Candidatus Omnitrophota bacterium]
MNEDNFKNEFSNSPEIDNNIFSSPRSIIALYTSLRILLMMRKELGLEAMLEYLNKNVETIENNNIQMKSAVTRALLFIDTKKIYEKAMFKE